MLNLGITRDKNQLTSLITLANKKQINIVALPVTIIETLMAEVESLPDFNKIDWLFFSSANGVHTFFAACNKEILPSTIKIAVVGKKTADAVHSYGLEIHFRPTNAYGKNLFEEFQANYSEQSLQILYIRAEKVNFDAQQFLAHSNIKYNELIAYRSVEHDVNKSEVDKLSSSDYLLFTAPSTVISYKKQFGSPRAKLIAIGNSTKEAIDKNNWTTDFILSKPEIESVLEQI